MEVVVCGDTLGAAGLHLAFNASICVFNTSLMDLTSYMFCAIVAQLFAS